jgi:hypothetical protein
MRPFLITLRAIINTDHECILISKVLLANTRMNFCVYRCALDDDLVIPDRISTTVADVIRKLLKKIPAKRLGSGRHGIDKIKKHPFFAVSSFPIQFIVQ